MTLTIWSRWAALGGRHKQLWTGSVPADENADPDVVNEQIFRMFNRVDEADNERLEKWGYRLPSLSVGDVITWNGVAYEVASVGFVPLGVKG